MLQKLTHFKNISSFSANSTDLLSDTLETTSRDAFAPTACEDKVDKHIHEKVERSDNQEDSVDDTQTSSATPTSSRVILPNPQITPDASTDDNIERNIEPAPPATDLKQVRVTVFTR